MPQATTKASSPKYKVEFKEDPFSLKILRKDNGAVLWDSSVGVFIFEDQFIQISTQPPSSFVYGFGEQEHKSFKHDLSAWEVLPIFTRDQFPFNGGNLYGHHPFYTCMENDGKSHGVFLMNSNAMDVALQPKPAITYRTIGGILDFYIFLGPSPEDVIKQYTEAIGRTFLPPYWSLGFQLSRWGYNNIETVKGLVANMTKYDLPQDVQFGDIDYMIREKDFTYDPVNFKDWPEFVRSKKKDGLRYIIILDPAIGVNDTGYRPYDWGNKLNVFIKDGDSGNNQNLFGKVWPTLENVKVNRSLPWDEQTSCTANTPLFQTISIQTISKYWGDLIEDFHKIIEFDGLWIDMNEPANFVHGRVSGCSDNKGTTPLYKPSAARKSTGKRSVVISRSTYASSGKYTGHWLGDNKSTWDQLHTSIIGMLEFNLFGIPYIGADVCGFHEQATSEMCLRWMQLGAFILSSETTMDLETRLKTLQHLGKNSRTIHVKFFRHVYRLLPFLYTLFYEAQMDGSTVVRPLMHEFADDKGTWKIDRQFLWGASLLISPVLDQVNDGTICYLKNKARQTVDAYFPDDLWYDYYTGKKMSTRKGLVALDAPLDHIPLHVRGGHIIPTQEPAKPTLLSALGDKEKLQDSSSGMTENPLSGLQFSIVTNGYTAADLPKWGSVAVYGLDANDITSLSVNSVDMKDKASFDKKTKVLKITGLSLNINEGHQIEWTVSHPKGTGNKVHPFVTAAFLVPLALITAFMQY
ncbi:hypothetical protein OS493_003605 [Desmophyllum pertusum]|uniref:Maltase n=1 Tax=Desmophyllum pertusum TaxID=174260 RepID=A0A9X0A5Q1_9CNID|nr:hypothetical protein OS493_003605 [Desmophyllum pertusum]